MRKSTVVVLSALFALSTASVYAVSTTRLVFKNTGLELRGLSGIYTTTLKQNSTEAANRTLNIPALGGSDTLMTLGTEQTVTGAKTFPAGSIARSVLATDAAALHSISLSSLKNINGTPLDASSSTGEFGLTFPVFGSNSGVTLDSEASNGDTKTDSACFEFSLPDNYVAGSNITVHVEYSVAGSGVLGSTKTFTVDAFKVGADGAQGTNLGPTADTLTIAAMTNHTYSITPTGLAAGDKLIIQMQSAVQETDSSDLVLSIGSVRVAVDVKG